MTTEIAVQDEVWIIIGNANGWGKADNFRDALANMFKETGYSHVPTEMVVYRWLDVPVDRVKDCYVDDFGTAHWPVLADRELAMKKLHVKDAAKLKKFHAAMHAFADAVEEFQYSGDMGTTFD